MRIVLGRYTSPWRNRNCGIAEASLGRVDSLGSITQIEHLLEELVFQPLLAVRRRNALVEHLLVLRRVTATSARCETSLTWYYSKPSLFCIRFFRILESKTVENKKQDAETSYDKTEVNRCRYSCE